MRVEHVINDSPDWWWGEMISQEMILSPCREVLLSVRRSRTDIHACMARATDLCVVVSLFSYSMSVYGRSVIC